MSDAVQYMLLGAGLALTLGAFWLRVALGRARKGFLPLRGLVVGYVARPGKRGETLRYAKVSFPYRGETLTRVAEPGLSRPQYRELEDVALRYHPEPPECVMLERSTPAAVWALVLAALGILLELAALVGILLA